MATHRNVLILGVTESGKSYAAAKAAREISRPFVVIVHVVEDETYEELLGRAQTRYVDVVPGRHTITSAFLDQTRYELKKRYLYLIVCDLEPEQLKAFLHSLIIAVKGSCNLALFFDEAHAYCKNPFVPSNLLGFSRGSRRYGVDLIYVTHKYYDLDISIRVNLSHMALFRTMEQRDLKTLQSELGLGDRVKELRYLPDWHHLYAVRAKGYVSPPMMV